MCAAFFSYHTSSFCRGGVIGEIWKAVGTSLERECHRGEKVRTGEVCMTSAGTLPCKRLLHTVGPRYNEQYKTAAENALHFCYRNSLRLCKEEKIKVLGMTCIYTKRKRYPRKEAAHIVLRTVRRFLEKVRHGARSEWHEGRKANVSDHDHNTTSHVTVWLRRGLPGLRVRPRRRL